jgi:UDP-glucose 4-epimerase
MTTVWIIGRKGLLGSALHRSLRGAGAHIYEQAEFFLWNDETKLFSQLEVAVKSFANSLGVEDKWQIYWAAGPGTMGSAASEMAIESRVLLKLIRLIESERRLMVGVGSFAFSSSAGAIYAGTASYMINEDSIVTPTTPYALEKLRQEKIVSRLVQSNSRISVLIARISTLYGTGQSNLKKQGLISCIARNIVRNQPTHIYVPLDTVRDYIAVDDAAAKIVVALASIEGSSSVQLKIVAAEKPTTIAEIILTFKRISRRTPRLITSANCLSPLYARRVQFCSINVPVKALTPRTSLPVGVAQLLSAERSAYVKGG